MQEAQMQSNTHDGKQWAIGKVDVKLFSNVMAVQRLEFIFTEIALIVYRRRKREYKKVP